MDDGQAESSAEVGATTEGEGSKERGEGGRGGGVECGAATPMPMQGCERVVLLPRPCMYGPGGALRCACLAVHGHEPAAPAFVAHWTCAVLLSPVTRERMRACVCVC